MFPLLIRDGLRMPYFALLLYFSSATYLSFGLLSTTENASINNSEQGKAWNKYFEQCRCNFLPSSLKILLVVLSVAGKIVVLNDLALV